MLGDGSDLGINITYKIQYKPKGIAESFIIAEDFIGDSKATMLILGDNIFHGLSHMPINFDEGAITFAYQVKNPSDYAVVEFNENYEVLSIEEKPDAPRSNYAMPGMYIYDNTVVEKAKSLKPSKRNELEITDLNNLYLKEKSLKTIVLPRGSAWLDAGLPEYLFESAAYIHAIQSRQGGYVGCIEEVAYKQKFITKEQLLKLIDKMPNSEYKDYITTLK